MWLYMLLGAAAVLAIIGSIALGGIFTIILIPLVVVALVAAGAYGIAARSAQPEAPEGGEDRPLPSGQQGSAGRVRTSPERLADARRVQQ